MTRSEEFNIVVQDSKDMGFAGTALLIEVCDRMAEIHEVDGDVFSAEYCKAWARTHRAMLEL